MIIMSTSGALVFFNAGTSPTAFPYLANGSVGIVAGVTPAAPAAPVVTPINVLVTDLNGNAMPAGTTVQIATTIGTLSGTGASYTVGCNESGGPGASSPYTVPTSAIPLGTAGGNATGVSLTSPATAGSGQISITVTSPEAKAVTVGTINVTIS
jgi:hypothetical protein